MFSRVLAKPAVAEYLGAAAPEVRECLQLALKRIKEGELPSFPTPFLGPNSYCGTACGHVIRWAVTDKGDVVVIKSVYRDPALGKLF